MDSSYIVKSNEWIMPAISVISIVMSIIMTLSSFNKQKSLHINHERLEYVYFPLVSFIKSCEKKRNMGAFDLYWYLKDKLINEKYKTLLGIAEIDDHFEVLENYCLSDEEFDFKKESSLFYAIANVVERNYDKIKKRAGYISKTRKYAFICFVVGYVCFLSWALLITGGDVTENTAVAYFTDMLLKIFPSSITVSVLFYTKIFFFEGGIYKVMNILKNFILSSKIKYSRFTSLLKKRKSNSPTKQDIYNDSSYDID